METVSLNPSGKLRILPQKGRIRLGFGSLILAQILYKLNPLKTLPDGTRVLENVGKLGESKDAIAYGSDIVGLNQNGNTEQSVELDIIHDLGVDIFTDMATQQGASSVPITDGYKITLDGISAGGVKWKSSAETIPNGGVTKLTFTANVISGTLTFSDYQTNDGSFTFDEPYIVVNGYNEINAPIWNDLSESIVMLSSTELLASEVDVTFNTLQQITTNNSYITLQDENGDIETIAHQGDVESSSKELVENGDFSDGLTGWTAVGSTLDTTNGYGEVTNTTGYGSIQKPYSNRIGATQQVTSIAKTISGASGLMEIPNVQGNSGVLAPIDWETQTFTFSGTPTSSIVKLKIQDSNIGAVYTWDNISVKEVLPISTTYKVTKPVSNYFATDVPLTDADRDYIYLYPEAPYIMWKTGVQNPNLSFSHTNIHTAIYLCNEGVNGGGYLRNMAVVLDTPPESWQDVLVSSANNAATIIGVNTFNFNIVEPEINAYDTHCRQFNFNPISIAIVTYNIIVYSGTLLTRSGYKFLNGVQTSTVTYTPEHDNKVLGIGTYKGSVYIDNFDELRYLFNATYELGVWDIDFTIREATASEITNFTNDCRIVNQAKGISKFTLAPDGDIAPINTIFGANDGRYIELPLDAPQDYLVTECVSHIEGDTTSVDITLCKDDEEFLIANYAVTNNGELITNNGNTVINTQG